MKWPCWSAPSTLDESSARENAAERARATAKRTVPPNPPPTPLPTTFTCVMPRFVATRLLSTSAHRRSRKNRRFAARAAASSGVLEDSFDIAVDPARGEFLEAPVESYADAHSNLFPQAMGAAIDQATQHLTELRSGGLVTGRDIERIQDGIAAARQRFAREVSAGSGPLREREARQYGVRIPPEEPHQYDIINAGNRHASYLDRAAEVFEHREKRRLTAQLSGPGDEAPVDLTRLEQVADFYHLVHPGPESRTRLARRAHALRASVVNERPEFAEAVDRLAEASFLLYHGTEYCLGTPSIVESMNDAILRATYGRTHGRKVKEPFWEAMFADPNADGLREFVERYPEFFSSARSDRAEKRGEAAV